MQFSLPIYGWGAETQREQGLQGTGGVILTQADVSRHTDVSGRMQASSGSEAVYWCPLQAVFQRMCLALGGLVQAKCQ